MALSKLGIYIELSELRNANGEYHDSDVVGLSTQKEMISTKADLAGVSLTSYKQLPPTHFAYVPDTSRRGDKMSLAFNATQRTFLVSLISVVFRVIPSKTKELLPEYLYIYFKRPEFDRYARFNSWGSAREAFSWDDMCDIEIDLPHIDVQQKYVDVYNAMVANQKAYEQGLEDLKLTCDAYLDELRRDLPHEEIGKYLTPCDERNRGRLGVESVRGIATSKDLISTKANLDCVELGNYKVMPSNSIAFVSDTSRRGDKISIALNQTNDDFLVSSISTIFTTQLKYLLPAYLMMFFSRSEFDRYARFNSWGSARETFSWKEMCEVKLPIPDIGIQQSIVNIYNAYLTRREINEKLKAQIKDLCRVLIKGSVEEARKS